MTDPKRQDPEREGELETIERTKSEKPRKYKVIFHNDDYTTQEFVIHVLERFFHKTETEARHIMLTVHHKGLAVAGVYTKDAGEPGTVSVTYTLGFVPFSRPCVTVMRGRLPRSFRNVTTQS